MLFRSVTLKTNALGLYRGHINKSVLSDDVQISCVKAGYKQLKTTRRSPPGQAAAPKPTVSSRA